MPRYAQRGIRFARVEWNPLAALAAMTAIAERPGPEQVLGLSTIDHNVAVQIVSLFSVQRNNVLLQRAGTMAKYKAGRFFGTETIYNAPDAADRADNLRKEGFEVMPIVGLEPLHDLTPGKGPIERWGPTLALALDRCSVIIAKSPRAGVEGGAPIVPVVEPITIAIIVGGVAVTVIAGVAVFRALDPDARIQLAQVQAATKAYIARLEVFKQTGKMPPVSAIEKSNAEAVVTRAREMGKSDWLIAGAAVGGTVAGAAAASYLLRGTA